MGGTADERGMRPWRIKLAVVVLMAQIAVAATLLWQRNVVQEGWGELPFSWQMYSERVD